MAETCWNDRADWWPNYCFSCPETATFADDMLMLRATCAYILLGTCKITNEFKKRLNKFSLQKIHFVSHLQQYRTFNLPV